MDNVVQFPADADSPIDITSPAFARRLGNLLAHRRTSSKLSVGRMARHSNKHFTRRDLRRYEAGHVTLDAVTAAALASLYKVDLDAILPARTEIEIDAGGGILRTGGIDALFEPGDPDSILETYLRLVRRLRNQEHDDVIALRRADIESLAAFLGRPDETVVEQLGALMGATKTQRRLMAGMFIAGAMVITVAVPTVAAITGDGGSDEPVSGPATTEFTEDLDAAGDPTLDDPPLPTADDTPETDVPGTDVPGTDAPGTDDDGPADEGPADEELTDGKKPADEKKPADDALSDTAAGSGNTEVGSEVGNTAPAPTSDDVGPSTGSPAVSVPNEPTPIDLPMPDLTPDPPPADPFADDEFTVGPPAIPADEVPLVEPPLIVEIPVDDAAPSVEPAPTDDATPDT